MVRKRTDTGGWYHEPPYTEEEEDMIYRGMDIDRPVTVLRGPSSVPPSPPRTSPPKPAKR
jgi:hypothetical protein